MKTSLNKSNFFISQKTKPLVKTLVVLLFVFVYFLIIWLLLGEFNLLKLNFIIYEGMFKNPNDPSLVSAAAIDSRIYYFLFLPGIFYIFLIMILKLCKQTAWDLIAILLSTWMVWVILILTAVLPDPYSILMITVRLLIVIATFFVLFFFTNFVVIKIIANPIYHKSMNTYLDFINHEDKTSKTKKYFETIFHANNNLILDVDPRNIFVYKKHK